VLLFEIVLGSPPEHIVCALPIEPADGAEQEEHAPMSLKSHVPGPVLEQYPLWVYSLPLYETVVPP